MNQVDLELRLKTEKADAAVAESAKRGRDLFEKKGFNLNLKSSNLPLGRITGDFDKFSGSLDAATARVLAFTATTTVVYGLSTAFSRLFTDSIKLEKQLASIQSILQTSNSNLQKFSSELFNVANATGQSFDVAAAAASEFARQGLSVEETLKATNAALTFSKIAGTDAAQTVENLTAALNTFANESLNYTDVLDTIVSLDNAFAISAAGISDGLKRVGSVASESGIQLKEIASLIAVVQQVSARGAPVISNGLKTIFTRLSRTSVQEALNNIGVATQNSNGEFRSQIEVLTDLANKLDSLSDSQRAFVLEQVAGVYQINTLQATLKSLSGEYSLFDKAVKVASDSSGNAANRLKILTDTTDANLQRLKNNVTQFLAEVGKTTVKPILDNFVGIGNKILETLNLGAAGEAGEKAGNSIGTYLLNGLSSVLSGPGTVLLVVGLGKLLTKVTKDAFTAVQTLAGLKQASLVDGKVQSSINKAIEMGNKALVDRLATTTSIVEKARILKNLMADMDRAQGVAQIEEAVSTGLRVNRKNIQPKGKNKAEGFIPTYSRGFIPDSMQRIEKKGAMAGGYSPKKVIAAPDSIGGVMNKAESLVSMEGMKQPFINPPKNSKAGRKHRKKAIEQTGIDPYALMSAGGFIPNFAYQVDKQNLGKNQVITINGSVTGRQSSLVADRNIDKVENLKYKVRQVANDYNNNFKNAVSKYQESGYKDSDWQSIESQLKSGKYSPDQIKTFKKNLESRETTGPSLVNGKKVSISRQITGIQSKIKGAYFENIVGNFLGKAISRNKVKVPESQNSRMDLLNSQGYSLGEIKSGNFSYDNLVSKAIASLSEETNVKYSNRIPQKIEFRKPYSLFVPSPTSSGGFIPNFASRYTEARKQKRDQLRASLFNIGDFAGGAIKNINAQTEFNQARDKNPNVEFDDKINQVGFKVERIPILDREFEDALRSKENNKQVTTKFENYAINYLNGKGYSFEAGRNTLYGKDNAAVDGYNIKQNFIELLEVKGGKWDAPDVNNKFGRFAPENLVDLGPQLVSKFFKEGNPDPNINDKIRIRNVLAIPNLTGGVFKSNINAKYPSADVKTIEKARQRTRPSGKKIPANMAWMLGVVEGMKESGATNASGFVPNFVNPGEKAVFPRTFDASTGTFKSPSGVSNIATLLNLLGAFTGDATLGNVLNGFETEMVVKTIMGSSQFLAAYAGEKGAGNLVGDAGKYGLKVTNSLQDRLRKIRKKISFGGGRTRKTSAEGFIPNFASRLSYKETQKAQKEAINREVASGQKRKDVKVGKSNSLRTAFNPMGFGVFNKYEKTLANGMGLAKKEGIDPRSKGMFASKGFIPNFAKNDDGSGFFIGSLKKAWAAYSEFFDDTVEMIQKVSSGELNKPSRQGRALQTSSDGEKKLYSISKEIADSLNKIEQDESLNADNASNFFDLREKRERSGTLGKEGGMEVKGSESRNLAADETRAVRKTLAEAKKGKQRREIFYKNPEDVGLSKENGSISITKKIAEQKKLINSNPELSSQYQKNLEEVSMKQIPTGEKFVSGLEGGMKDKKSRARNLAAIETRVIRKTIADSKKQSSQINTSNQASPSLPNPPGSPIPDNPANISAADRMRGVKPINNPSSVPTFPSSVPPLRPPGGGGPPTPPEGGGPPTPPGLPSPTEKDKKSKGKGLRGSRLSNAKLGAAGALAFAIPSITGALSTPEEGKEQTTTQKNIQAGGEAIGAGLAAATTTALIPGLAPIAPVVGVAVTAFKLLTAASKNAVPSIESITKQNQKLIASNEKQLTSLDSAVQKTQEISQLKSSGADPRKIAKAEIELSKSLIGIGDEGLVNTLKNEKNDTKKQEAILAFQEKKTKEKNLSESLTGAATLSQQAQTERAGGFRGTIGSSLDIAAQVTEFFGGKGAAEFVKPVSELIKGPKQDFGTEQWDQFINPIIDSLDLSKLTSEDAAKGLKRLAGGTQDLGSFIREFGAEAGMSSSQIQQITQSLNSLSSAYSPESISSLNQYTGGVIKLNQQLASNAVAKNTPVINVNFQKVFEKALQDLTLDTALTNYKQFSDKGSNLSISKNQLALDQQAGKFSQTQGIRKQSQMQGQEETLRFNKEGTDIVTSAVEKLLAIIPEDLNNDQRSAIVQESKNVLTRGGDLTKLEDLIRDSVANSGKSNDILEEIAKINEETTQSIEKLKIDRSAATKTRTAVEEANVQAAQDAAASQRGADIISGAAAQAPKGKLLDVKLLAENNAKIEKLTAQAQLAGGNRTERGRSIISQANALELQNARMREQDLIAQSTAFGAPNVTGQEEAQAANKAIGDKDFAKNLAAETGNLLQQLNASKAQKGERQLFSSKDIKSITQGIEIGGEGATQARALIESKLGDTSAESQVNQDIINRVKTLGGENSIFNDKKPPAEEPRPAWEAATQRLAQESLTGRMGSDELLRSQTTGLKDQAVSEAEAAKKEADAAREALSTFSAKETEVDKSKAAQTQGANRAKIQNLEESLGSVGRTTWDEKGFGGKALTSVLNSPLGAIPQGVAAGYQKLGLAPNSGPLFGDYGFGQKKQTPEAQQTSADLSSFLDKIKSGNATKSDFEALKKSLDDKGRSTEDIADRQKFIKGVEDLQIPFAEDNDATLAEKKKNLETVANEKQAIADQKNAAAEVAKKNVENFAGDPSQTLKFLQNPAQKEDALRKLKESKDPNLKSLGEKITSLDLKKEELKKIKDQEELSGLAFSKTPLNEQQMKRKAELESAGVKAEELSTSQKDRKKELEAGIGKDTNAIIAEGKRSYGAINSTLYKDQVAPGVLDLVTKQEDKAKVESYNAKVLERQAQESQLSTTNEEITGIQAQEAQRRKVSSAFLADKGSSMSLDEKYAITSRFNKGEITADEANQLTGGALKNAYKSVTNKEEGFENLNNIGNIQTKLGNREILQQGVEKAKAEESELSKAMQPVLEAITGFANAQAAATEAQKAAAQEEKTKKEAGQEAGASTTEGGEKKITTTSNINVTVTGGSLTDSHVAQLEKSLKTYSAETIITAFKNAGFPAPNLGPVETAAIA